MADGDPRKQDHLTPAAQRAELEARLRNAGGLNPTLEIRHPFHGRVHMRYVRLGLSGGGERLFIFERGLDMADPKDGKSRGDSFVLEFSSIPNGIASLIGGRV